MEIKKKANKLQGLTDTELLLIFVGGLPVQIKKQVEIFEPSTLEKAFERARLIERIENENEDGLSVQGLQEFTIRLQEELQEEKEFTVEIQEKLREKEAKLAEHEKNKEREEKEVKELLQKLDE